MDPSEPERKSTAEEAVNTHHHVHVEIPDMGQSKALAVKDHHHPGHLGPFLLHYQLKEGEDASEEVKEGHLSKKIGKVVIADVEPPVVATGRVLVQRPFCLHHLASLD